MKKTRKAFTLVELLVVIAILAVLATVGIVGYTSFTKKAKESNDRSVISQLNLALQATETSDGKPKTMYEALKVVEGAGFVVANLTPDSDGYDYIYDMENNRFALINQGGATVAEATDKTLTDEAVNKWLIAHHDADLTRRTGFSVYLADNYDGALTFTNLKTGLDCGNLEVSSINYTGGASAQEVVIRTNGDSCTLTVNAPNDSVYHYNSLSELTVTAIASASYHEFGSIKGKATISEGHFVVEKNAIVPQVEVVSATNTVKVTANDKTIVSVDDDSDDKTTVVANSSNVFVSGLSQSDVSGNAVIAESVNDEASLLAALEKGYVQFDGDVTINRDLTISNTAVIDLNGHTFVVNGLILNNGDLTIDDSKDNGQKKVSNVVNDAVSAKTSTDVSTESSLSYTKTLQGTLKVESIKTSSNNKLTILNGSFVSDLDYHKYYGTDNQTNGLIRVENNATCTIYNGAFFSENIEDATEQYAAAAVAVIANLGNTTIYKGEFVTKYCRENRNIKPQIQYSYYTLCSWGGNFVLSPKTNSDIVVYAARGSLSLNSGNASIMGGTFNAYHYYAAYIAGSAGYVKGTISGGEFNLINGGHLSAAVALYIGNDSAGDGGKRLPANVTILDCVVNSDKGAINVANMTGSIVVYGGKYNKTINENFIDTNNYKIVNEDGYYVVKAK